MIEKLHILGRTWSVRGKVSIGDDGRTGECNHRTNQIHIAPDQPPINQGEILLHEILHVVFTNARIEHSESDVARTATILFGIVRDNPDAIRHILAGRRIVGKP